ncbi:trehalase-like isoform X2 [Haliotis rubra]|nr:trehalase-like isoform X2 [Haliotis rubra]XP_046572735.1 trehalase-like isoform X2 [Haliotis rubra]XP_046572736.1 trehalase-like isoform X2 [Haliotis rubra]XP_046572737.1 trehalase-like isoform X2 [Haliotis rubra]XP_046572738.1 trehalase-like isoform X2 [Haliotis rubra]XP_046572739.1 trehalase-like isoform X2 [Haliotis rubra]
MMVRMWTSLTVSSIVAVLCMVQPSAGDVEGIYPCDSQIYCRGQLLDKVQMARIYRDSKTFVDMNLKEDPVTVLRAFNTTLANAPSNNSQIQAFVDQYFEGPGTEFEEWTPGDYVENPAFLADVKDNNLKQFGKSLCGIWEQLGRKIKNDVRDNQERYSLLYVENPFIIPGGRFRETYYWDSLWVVHGLLRCEMTQTVSGMLENFFFIIDRYSFVPNGFRVYYQKRSQPPVLAWMVESYYDVSKDRDALVRSLGPLEREYQFWMTNRSVEVQVNGQTHTLNLYNTVTNTPRPESYAEDVETAGETTEEQASGIYTNLASAAESGWDFSSRWFSREDETNMRLNTTVITDIIPVDLNSILCRNERLLARFYNITGNSVKSRYYSERYERRKDAIKEVLWNQKKGVWQDYYIPDQSLRDYFFPSNVFPMYAGCYGNTDAEREMMEEKVVSYLQAQNVLQYEGGVPTSLSNTGQQWDLPNAWPPLQHVIITSLAEGRRKQSKALAIELAQRWVYTNWLGWKNTRHMFEKYDVDNVGRRGGGGEYDSQTGFGWTNGVVLDLLSRHGDILTTDTSTSEAPATMPSMFICVYLFVNAMLAVVFHR